MTCIANGNEGKYVDYMFPTPYVWKRPEGPPHIWHVVAGRKKTADGQIPKFSVQEVPEELEDEVVEFMIKYYLVEEPRCVELGTANDPIAVRERRTYWRNLVRQGVTAVALKVNSDPAAKPVIAGVNILAVITAEDADAVSKTKKQFKAEANEKWIRSVLPLYQEADPMKKYGVDRCLSSMGLSVLPTLRGQGLGQQLIRARQDIGITYQIPMSATLFSAYESQVVAARNGYEVILERNHSEILDDEGKVVFPGVNVKSIKIMAKRLY